MIRKNKHRVRKTIVNVILVGIVVTRNLEILN